MTGEIPREANLSPRGVVNSGFRAKSSQLRAQFVKTRALASDSRVLDGSTGNTTPVCLSNEPKSDSTRLSLPELEFGHYPLKYKYKGIIHYVQGSSVTNIAGSAGSHVLRTAYGTCTRRAFTSTGGAPCAAVGASYRKTSVPAALKARPVQCSETRLQARSGRVWPTAPQLSRPPLTRLLLISLYLLHNSYSPPAAALLRGRGRVLPWDRSGRPQAPAPPGALSTRDGGAWRDAQ